MTFQAAVRTAFIVALVSVAGAIAQGPAPPLTLRVNTQLVQVSVVVRDSHGNPVTDLKASDFELYDKDKRQEIRIFKVEDYGHAGSAVVQPSAPSTRPPSRFPTGPRRNQALPTRPPSS
jgi:hypothetical protein